MKLVYLSILFIITVSCCTSKGENSSSKDDTITESELKKNTDFEEIFSSAYGGKDVFSYMVFENYNDLNEEMQRLNILNQLPEIQNFNFDNKAILFLHMGQKNSGGYAISIDKIERISDEIVIYHNRISPKKGENVTMALSNPYSVFIIPRAKKYSVK